MRIGIDATYSLGGSLSGVGIYSRELIRSLAETHPKTGFRLYYRPHRFLRSFRLRLPANCSRRLLLDSGLPPGGDLFHGLNQRVPRVRPRRTVTTFHDLFVLTGEYSTADFRHRFAAQAREAAEASDRIIAVSRFTADQVHQLLGVERSRIRVVHHGVNSPERVPSETHENPQPGPSGTREKMVLHVGAVQRRKNIVRLVQAFERTAPSDWKLVLAGSAGFEAEEILKRIDVSPRRHSILLTGYASPEELSRLYARARIFAFPSLDEGFGMPVLEAMTAGVPVIASNKSALPEVCGDAALLVNPEDVESIGEALLRLIEDEELAASLQSRGKARAALFSWRKAAAETWAVYRELLS